MNECILHFGMYKTGSTSIQQTLFRNLRDPGLTYLHFGRANSSASIATAFREDPHAFHHNRKQGLSEEQVLKRRRAVRRQLREQLAQAVSGRVLLSAESLCGLEEPDFRTLVAFLSRHTARVRAVGYVRDPAAYLASDMQQRFKDGTRVFDPGRSWPAYRRRLEKFEQVLGAENVMLWRFDPSELINGCVVQDFCARLRIALAPADVIRQNESLSLPAVQLLYAYRRFGPGFGRGPHAMQENATLIDRLRELRGPPFALHPALIAAQIEAHRQDVEWIDARLDRAIGRSAGLEESEATIGSEADLLQFRPEALEWLAAQLGPGSRWQGDPSPRAIADAMHYLRLAPRRQKDA